PRIVSSRQPGDNWSRVRDLQLRGQTSGASARSTPAHESAPVASISTLPAHSGARVVTSSGLDR
ncbi:hypothetical protein, partial [Mycobacterium tuberculosis]|uniref:hypothetical protein n=1 Tax=Mycobacterium tuberculosis TaxID=1773 RepID=UPI001BDDFD80